MSKAAASDAVPFRDRGRLRPATAVRLMRWELRGSRARVFFWTLCLAVGVGAVVGVAGLGASLEQALRREARSLLAADVALFESRPMTPEARSRLDAALASEEGVRIATLREIMGVVRRAESRERGANSQMVGIKAVTGPYPFYGELDLEGAATEPRPGETLAERLGDDSAVVGRELLDRLGLEIGDAILLGQQRLEITDVVRGEPDRLPGTIAIGPRVFVGRAVLDASGISGFSGFTRNKTLLGLPPGSDAADAEALAEKLKPLFPQGSYVRVETYADAQPSLRRDLERLENYLGLAALLSLLIGGVGIAQGVTSWINSRIDSLAILKCLGVRPREAMALYLAQAVFLGIAGSLAGCLFGLAVLWGVPQLLADFVPTDSVRLFQPLALLRGLALGVGVAVAFSLPPLLSVLRVPPNRVFRRTAEPLPGSKTLPAIAFVTSLLVVGTLAALQSDSVTLAALFVGGVLATVVALGVGSLAVAKLAGVLSSERQPFWLRHGLAALSRPGAGTLGAIIALGIGLFVILTMSLVQAHLRQQIEGELPSEAPSAFLVDVRPDQWPDLRRTLLDQGAQSVDAVPVVRARIAAIDGVPAQELMTPANRWALRREQRITYLSELPADNEVIEGALWARDDAMELSLEEEFASEIGAGVGSIVRLEVDREPLDFEVTSLRRVNWEGFGINFFLVAEPGSLDHAPQIRLAAARLPTAREQAAQDSVAEAFPNVLYVPIRELLDKILVLLGRLLVGVRVLGSFTVLSGLAILFGAVATSHAQRGREVALLKTLGMTRLDVLKTFAVEYALVGLAAATIATAGALAVAGWVVTQEMEIPWSWHYGLIGSVLLGGSLLSVVAGTLASSRALAKRPAHSLRQE